MSQSPQSRPGKVPGVRLDELHTVVEPRGRLSAAEVGSPLPFAPQRCFVISDVPPDGRRGEHAHTACEQFLICLRGSVSARTDNGEVSEVVVLDRPTFGLYMPPMIWGGQFDFSPDAILLVLASHLYDTSEYIYDYGEFLTLTKQRRAR
jgi:hypothetical protein